MRAERWADRTWSPFAKSDPFYGVLNDDKFRSDRMDERAKAAFFASGQAHVDSVLATIRRHVDPDFAPRSVLDFGSGVGRLLIPFARNADRALGVDISTDMMAEAQKNCVAAGLTNVEFAVSDKHLSKVPGNYDLVHSFIVIQHIPPAWGEHVFRALVSKIAPGGVGALHVTYARVASPIRKVVHRMRIAIPLVNVLVNVVQRRPTFDPLIPMFEYDLARLFRILHDESVHDLHVTLTDHGGHLGAMLVFRGPKGAAS